MITVIDKTRKDKCLNKDVFRDDGALAKECDSTVRYTGIVLIVTINYDNTHFGAGSWKEVDYRIHVKALPLSQAEIERVSLTGRKDSKVRYEARGGILIMVQQEGKLGRYNFQAMLLNLTAGLGLLAVAKVVTLFVAKTICPLLTDDHRYKSLIVQESPDFNEEAEGGASIHDKEANLLDNHKDAEGGREMKSMEVADLRKRIDKLERTQFGQSLGAGLPPRMDSSSPRTGSSALLGPGALSGNTSPGGLARSSKKGSSPHCNHRRPRKK